MAGSRSCRCCASLAPGYPPASLRDAQRPIWLRMTTSSSLNGRFPLLSMLRFACPWLPSCIPSGCPETNMASNDYIFVTEWQVPAPVDVALRLPLATLLHPFGMPRDQCGFELLHLRH